MTRYICEVCEYIYDQEVEGTLWTDLPDTWLCPVCESAKSYYKLLDESPVPVPDSAGGQTRKKESVTSFLRDSDDLEQYMADIHKIAETGQSIIEPMRTRKPTIGWDDVLIKGAQLAKIPLNHEDQVRTKTVIGPRAQKPLILETPIYITHMSFGALSKEAKIALARGSATVKTAMCSGEGGILPDSLSQAHKYIFEYVPNKYSVTEANIKAVDAIEIKIGQSAKPGLGGHLPGDKVTAEIAELRGFKIGQDIVSPAHFSDIRTKEDLKSVVAWLRETSEGRPIGIKIAAGNIEADMEVVVYAEPDFVTIDGRAGATGAAPKFVKAATSVPTIFALSRARKFLDQRQLSFISLLITGGLRISPDFAKALALGADAVAIGSSALIAISCQQWRMCNTGKCPMGIATQDPELRGRFDIDKSARQLGNFLRVSTEELKDFARLTGHDDVHQLSERDLCTTNTEISTHTPVEHV
ncbi:glutamate synthase-related protein [candidate division CSSED10-310 bacterium]|uniref:Glutamate synthase-related protein n=1 Tax=candidate division CSSED10-310 bacterium TaxID=2855610 RepID=A0ABV6YT81_UNCC1